MKTGYDLVEEVFGEEAIDHLREIEEVDGVEDYTENLSYNSGWYNYYEVTFKFKGKKYSFEFKSHTSDNVCDMEFFYESFKEIEEMITISLSEYQKLQVDSEFLSCLKACGVDNWRGFDEAWNMVNEEE